MRSTSVICVVVAVLLLGGAAAFAQANIEHPFCAYGSKVSEGSTRCDFATLAQCQAWISGGSGSCVPNPRISQGGPRNQTAVPDRRR